MRILAIPLEITPGLQSSEAYIPVSLIGETSSGSVFVNGTITIANFPAIPLIDVFTDNNTTITTKVKNTIVDFLLASQGRVVPLSAITVLNV